MAASEGRADKEGRTTEKGVSGRRKGGTKTAVSRGRRDKVGDVEEGGRNVRQVEGEGRQRSRVELNGAMTKSGRVGVEREERNRSAGVVRDGETRNAP
jgi:hypothetical protein